MRRYLSSSMLFGLCLALSLSVTGWMSRTASAVPVTVSYTDGAGEGFNDPTLGLSRRTAFEYALNIWAAALQGTVTIVVDAQFNPLAPGLLGSAGATHIVNNFTGAPLLNTWYPVGLANQLSGSDENASSTEITATFSTNFTFYYGLDSNPGPDFDFVSVVLHEFCHGFGFGSVIQSSNGAFLGGFPSRFDTRLLHQSVGQIPSLTDGQRLTAITSSSLYWNGPNVVTAASGNVQMYAPPTYVPGSSVSHWDTSLTPDELMEYAYTSANHNPGYARYALKDIDWSLLPTPTPTEIPVPVSGVNQYGEYR